MNQPFAKSLKQSSKPDKFCPGCGHSIVLKSLGSVIDILGISQKTLIGIDIGCSLLAWDYFDVPTVQTHHGRTVPVISGYKLAAPDKIGIAYLGDGGGYAIGLQALITATLRNDPITVILINNTLYGMTGGQMAPTTLCKEITSTTQTGKQCKVKGQPILGPEMLNALPNKKSYLARGIVTKPLILQNLFKKAIEHQIKKQSFSFVEVLSTCPTNWRKKAKESIEMVEKQMTGQFALGEISKLNKTN